jgi:dihydroxyacetone kinase-like predicted kinase
VAKRGESPSAKGFYDKIRSAGCDEVLIFPNDKNAILAAKQAAELYEKARSYIIPSTNIAECYAALSLADSHASASDMTECFERAVGRVKCALLSPAVKGCSLDGVDIKRGDTVGIIKNKIVFSHKERLECALAVADVLLSDKSSMLTVYRGKGADRRECRRITDAVSEKYPNIEIYEIYSAEELYPYILAAE